MAHILKQIYKLGSKDANPLKLGYLYRLGQTQSTEQLISQAQFLHGELPIRLGGRVQDLDNLPYGLAYQPSVKDVRNLYVNSFTKIYQFNEIKTHDDAKFFTEMLQNIKDHHFDVPKHLGEGVAALKDDIDAELYNSEFKYHIDHFLNRFYLCRIGIRTLIDLHIQSFNQTPYPLIKQINPKDIFDSVYSELEDISRSERFDLPEIQYVGNLDMTITYIPSHIHYALLEVLKNSVYATIKSDSDIPIIVDMFETVDDFVIKVIDKGKGFRRNKLDLAFSYLYTTSTDKGGLSGYGHGLPLARLYTRYFDGDLQLIPFKGIGTDAVLYFSKLNSGTEVIC